MRQYLRGVTVSVATLVFWSLSPTTVLADEASDQNSGSSRDLGVVVPALPTP